MITDEEMANFKAESRKTISKLEMEMMYTISRNAGSGLGALICSEMLEVIRKRKAQFDEIEK